MKKTTIFIFLMALAVSVLAQVPTALPTITCTSCTPNISAIVPDGTGGVYVGGTFTSIGGVAAKNLAHINSNGTVDTNWLPSVTDGSGNVTTSTKVKTIAVYGQFVYIGGTFAKVGTQITDVFNNFAAIRISDGQAVNTITTTYPINKILLSGNTMYIAANASDGTIGGIGTTVAKALIGTQTSTDPGLATFSGFVCKAGTVNDMYLNGSTLYIVGTFSQVISSSTTDNRANLAEVSTTTGAATTFFNGKTFTATQVNAVEVVNNILFVGGLFTNIAGTAVNNFAAIDLSNGAVLTANNYALGTAGSGSAIVYDMTSYGTDLYVVGNFTTFLGSATHKYIAALINPSTTATGRTALPGVNGVSSLNSQVKSIYVASSSNMAIGGDFTSPQNYLTALPYVTPVITFGTLADKTYGDASFSLSASVTEGGSVSFASSDPTIASISGSTVTILKSGSVTITASSTGAVSVQRTLTINKKSLTATADNKSRVFNTTNPAFTITYSGFVNSETVANITAPTASTTAIQSSNVGTYPITLTGGSANNYNITNVNGTLTIDKAGQTITFNALPAKTIGDADFNLTATSTSGLTISYVSSNTTVAEVNGTTVTIKGVGSTIITASQAGNSNYNAATTVDQTLTVNSVPKSNQTITFNALPAKTVGDANFNLTATASSGLTVTYTSSNTSVATVSGSTVTIVGAGSTIITASQAGNASFNAAPSVDQTLTVNAAKANQTITFNALTAKTYGDADFNLTATSSSGLLVTYTSSNTTVAEVNGTTVTIKGAGSAIITASQAGNASFNAATSVDQTLTVNKANQTITFDDLNNVYTTDESFDLTATSSSGLLVTYTSSNTSVATVTGSTVTIVGAGTTTITASQVGNANYNAASQVQKTLTVIQKQNQTITFNALPQDKKIDDQIQLTATSSSGLEVEFSSSDDNIAEVMTGNVLVLKAFGTVTITAHQKGNDIYNAVSVYQDIIVNKKDQTITFNTLSNGTVGEELTLVATASSNLTVDFESSNPAIAEVVGNVLKLKAEGTVTIKANQKGNDVYKSKTVSQEITVNSIITAVVDAERPTLSAYPNPTTDIINIQTASSKMKQVVIYTMDGRVMDQLTSSSEEVQFTVSSYNTGIYIVKISDSDNSATIKFVKK